MHFGRVHCRESVGACLSSNIALGGVDQVIYILVNECAILG